jgi:hypothetical protein
VTRVIDVFCDVVIDGMKSCLSRHYSRSQTRVMTRFKSRKIVGFVGQQPRTAQIASVSSSMRWSGTFPTLRTI